MNSVLSTVAFPVFSLVQSDTNKMRLGYIVMPGLIALSASTERLTGVAGTLACFYLILIFLSYRILVRPFWGECGKEILLAIGRPTVLTLAAALVIGVLRVCFEQGNTWFTVITSLAIGGSCYIALAFLVDRQFTRSMLKAVVR